MMVFILCLIEYDLKLSSCMTCVQYRGGYLEYRGRFCHFESLAFFENVVTNLTPKQSNRIFLDIYSKEQQK